MSWRMLLHDFPFYFFDKIKGVYKMNNEQKEKVNEIKRELGKIRQFRNRCYVCHVSWHKRGMTFHHIKYKTNEKTHSNFPDGYAGTLQYYEYLKPIIKKNPKRFAYLCNPHHQTVTKLLQFSKDKQDRIFKLVRKSR